MKGKATREALQKAMAAHKVKLTKDEIEEIVNAPDANSASSIMEALLSGQAMVCTDKHGRMAQFTRTGEKTVQVVVKNAQTNGRPERVTQLTYDLTKVKRQKLYDLVWDWTARGTFKQAAK